MNRPRKSFYHLGWEDEVNLVSIEPTSLSAIPTFTVNQDDKSTIDKCFHPDYTEHEKEWAKWRDVYNAGDAFRRDYIKKFSRREKSKEFEARLEVSTIPAFATAAINDVRNAISSRLCDVTRVGGTKKYQSAVLGAYGGVTKTGASLNWFLANKVITDLLVMKRVGIFVDMPAVIRPDSRPYLYTYKSEDILNWRRNEFGQFSFLVLRDHIDVLHPKFQVPIGCTSQYRLLYLKPEGGVGVVIFDSNGKPTGDPITLALPAIPFVMPELSHSLMANVANHQIAHLNLESADVAFLLRANYVMYTEQRTGFGGQSHLKTATLADDPTCNPTELNHDEIEAGGVHGRTYAKDAERPGFIAPPTGPVEVSMKKQAGLKDDIRLLVNLALSSVKPGAASAESKLMDQADLEAGLYSIGIELEFAERQIEKIWASYEREDTNAIIKYPNRYSLKSDKERREEVDDLQKSRAIIPSLTFQKLVMKKSVDILVGDRIPAETLEKIHNEIDDSKSLISDLDSLIEAEKEGLVTKALASTILGFPADEVEKAKVEHAERLTRIAAIQGAGQGAPANQAARGLRDADPNPASGSDEKEGKPKRGENQE